MRHHPETVQIRYLAPPTAVAAIAVGSVAGLLGAVKAGPAWLRIGWLAPTGYFAAVSIGGMAISRDAEPVVRARVPVVLATMHLAWGVGFLTSRPQVRDPR